MIDAMWGPPNVLFVGLVSPQEYDGFEMIEDSWVGARNLVKSMVYGGYNYSSWGP